MAGIDQGMVSKILNATLPTGTSGVPGTWTALSASAMKLRLNSTSSTASAAGTQITGTGYTAGGSTFGTASTASSAGSSVTCPAGSAISWTNTSGSSWSVQSFDITDNAGVRCWFGDWNGAPVSIANNNTFTVAVGAITIGLA